MEHGIGIAYSSMKQLQKFTFRNEHSRNLRIQAVAKTKRNNGNQNIFIENGLANEN